MDAYQDAAGGRKEVGDDWVSGTGLRALIQEDPCLLWLKFHGAAFGFQEDPKEYSFLEFIGDKGRAFEEKWTTEVCPEAKQALDKDTDVRRVQGLMKTLELMDRRVPVITKAALWWAPCRLYGSADLICLTSWLYARFPHLAPAHPEPDHYVVLDCKFSSGLDAAKKKIDLACNSAQVRMYSYMLGHLQGHMPKRAYLVTRDRPFDPLPVNVEHTLGGKLDPELAHLRDLHVYIKQNGAQHLPWRDEIVAPNFSNEKDEPWHTAKKRIARELVPGGALELLPHIGRSQAEALKQQGYESVGSLLMYQPERLPLEKLHGIGKKTAPKIRAVLEANRSGSPSAVDAAILPSRSDIEMFVDFEYFTNVNVDFEKQWPEMTGREMIFLIGVGWQDRGTWHWKRFAASREDYDAEREMLEEFLSFLEDRGVFRPGSSAALYHWSNAEVWQSKKAAERHGLDRLAELPWQDLQKPFHDGPIAVPGAWDFGLKSVAAALGSHSPDHKVEWPEELGAGLGAMVMGWEAYGQPEPLETAEMDIVTSYLEIDCKAMWTILKWLRDVAVAELPMARSWYEHAKREKKPSKKRDTKKNSPSRAKRRRRGAVEEIGRGWYRFAMLGASHPYAYRNECDTTFSIA